jgi:signal peptidase I
MNKNKSHKKKSAKREWVEAFFIAAVIAVVVRTLFFQMYRIPTESMVPVLKPGDRIFVTRLAYGPRIPILNKRLKGLGEPQRGDIVVFVPPQETTKPWYKRKQFIKRLIAVGGDEVLIESGDIYINGQKEEDPRIAKNYYRSDPRYGDYGTEGNPIRIPENEFYFLGDNSGNSSDGRVWGYVDRDWIVGKALFIWFPFHRIGVIE